jgi:hypothetical protein
MSEEQKEATTPLPDSQKTPETSVSESKKTENTTLSNRIARRWLQGGAWLINFIIPTILSILLGFSPLPQSIPLIALVQQHPLASLAVCGVLALVTVLALFIAYKPKLADAGRKPQWQITNNTRPWIVVTALSTVSTVLCLVLLLVVLLRPSWCPNALCPAPQVLALTHPNGIHDANLDLYPINLQSKSFVLAGNVASYSQNNIPNSIGAVRLDWKQTPPYRVVLGVNSLSQGRFGVVIEEVALKIKQVPPIPRPLNVWSTTTLDFYNTYSYHVDYRGQNTDAVLPATYISLPNGFLQLAPGEPDQFNVQISSSIPADIQFNVQVTYRVTNELVPHVLTLPHVYEVVFSNASNWHEYQLQDGHFVGS